MLQSIWEELFPKYSKGGRGPDSHILYTQKRFITGPKLFSVQQKTTIDLWQQFAIVLILASKILRNSQKWFSMIQFCRKRNQIKDANSLKECISSLTHTHKEEIRLKLDSKIVSNMHGCGKK